MAVNPHFNNTGVTSELNLNKDLLEESIKMAGIDVYYIPRKINTIDELMNEVTHSSFEQSFLIEVYFEGFENFAPNSMLMDKLGLGFAAASITAHVSTKRFKETIPNSALHVPNRPNEGDLIFIPHTKVLLEIKKGDIEKLMKTGGEATSYAMECELFKSSSEPMEKDNFISNLQNIPQALMGTEDIIVDEPEYNDQSDLGDNDLFDSSLIIPK